ncbi:MAG: 30S ribosomal protein S16 [Patescibacteria group bacterium]
MLKLRLQRVGRKNDPSFRVVVTESQNGPQSGKFLEVLGSYDARQGKPLLNGDRIKHWIGMGALTSDTVNNMLIRFGIIKGKKVNNLPKVKPVEAKAVATEPVAAAKVEETEIKPAEDAVEPKSEALAEETAEAKAEEESVPVLAAPTEETVPEVVVLEAAIEPVAEMAPEEAPTVEAEK